MFSQSLRPICFNFKLDPFYRKRRKKYWVSLRLLWRLSGDIFTSLFTSGWWNTRIFLNIICKWGRQCHPRDYFAFLFHCSLRGSVMCRFLSQLNFRHKFPIFLAKAVKKMPKSEDGHLTMRVDTIFSKFLKNSCRDSGLGIEIESNKE